MEYAEKSGIIVQIPYGIAFFLQPNDLIGFHIS